MVGGFPWSQNFVIVVWLCDHKNLRNLCIILTETFENIPRNKEVKVKSNFRSTTILKYPLLSKKARQINKPNYMAMVHNPHSLQQR